MYCFKSSYKMADVAYLHGQYFNFQGRYNLKNNVTQILPSPKLNIFFIFTDICSYAHGKPISDDSILMCHQCPSEHQCVRDENYKLHCCPIDPGLGICDRVVKLMNIDIMDAFVPLCSESGWYAKEQCYDYDDRVCWCVTRDGEEIPDSRVAGFDNSTDCDQCNVIIIATTMNFY